MDGREVLSKVSGLKQKVVNEIWENVKANRAMLESCSLHDFSIDLKPEQAYGKRFRCSKCGGEVDHITKLWYEKGIEHARKKAGEDVDKG